MRVLTVGNRYPPQLGGYELIWAAAVEHLRRRGHEVAVLTTGPPREDDPPHVARELRWYWRRHRFSRRGPLACLRIERHNVRVLDGHLDRVAPDVVAWFSMGGMSMGLIERVRRAGVPAAAIVGEHWPAYGPRVDGRARLLDRRPRLRELAESRGLPVGLRAQAVDRWLFVSQTLRQAVEREVGRLPGSVVHPGPDLRLFAPQPPPPWGWRLLYVGRVEPRKGVDTAIAALGRVPAATLDVVDAGPSRYLSWLRRFARRCGVADRVRFRGTAPRSRLPELYAQADAVVFPVRWDEPWGLVPLEAMAVGRPVVATGLGGSGEYLRDGDNCVLYACDDGPDGLAGAVARLQDGALRARLRQGGLETARRYDQAAFNRAIEEACRAVAA